ncbi:TetR/AcrR family transcriptional regulator [Cohnella hongkongensis]|uniref:TetR/AcrR family transcriptional regulator n=1 Tax=Cohnella hongkongensis TaxID=178337 RepID=A0ABV9FAW2_9BACL
MDGYERRKRQKRKQVHEAAFELFVKYGFQKVSVNEIAERANVSPATIYNYYGTKEQLYADTLTSWMDERLERYERLLESEMSFPGKTRELIRLEAESLKLLTAEWPQLPSAERNGWMRRMDSYGDRKVGSFFRRYVALGKREGFIHRELSEETAMRYFAMFKNELIRYWGAEGKGEERSDPDMEQWTELFFYGLAGRGRDPRD